MRFVSLMNEGQMYPEASPSGDQGDLLDTGWDVLWPGPARVYLSESDLRDLVVADGVLDLPLVAEALKLRGWTPQDELAVLTAAVAQELDQATSDLEAARAEADGLLLALRRCAPDEIVERELVAAGVHVGEKVGV